MTIRNRKKLIVIAQKLEQSEELSADVRLNLAGILRSIGEGADANEAFELKRKPGEKESDELVHYTLSFLFHWISNAILPEEEGGLSLTKAEAIRRASAISKSQRSLKTFSEKTLKSHWNNKKHFMHKRIEASPKEEYFPYY
ncbi:hypothetical protein N9Q44_01715 [Gammaproteobacteria bacterium]|nr:hypothetical protein [Gammaproteobacteria bacterium]